MLNIPVVKDMLLRDKIPKGFDDLQRAKLVLPFNDFILVVLVLLGLPFVAGSVVFYHVKVFVLAFDDHTKDL